MGELERRARLRSMARNVPVEPASRLLAYVECANLESAVPFTIRSGCPDLARHCS
jgi:hypothetical protein